MITPGGDALIEPADAELASRVGLATTPSNDFYDLIIVGGGPAGLGAAVYGASEGLRTVLVERLATGGQAGQSSRIENYLVSGCSIGGAAYDLSPGGRPVRRRGADRARGDRPGGERLGQDRPFADGSAIDAHAVILATGVSYRRLHAPGLAELAGRGVYYGSALTEATACAGQDVYIVGGANSAGQAALFLYRYAKSVTLLVRGPSLEKSMSYYLISRINDNPAISVRTCTEVIRYPGMTTWRS